MTKDDQIKALSERLKKMTVKEKKMEDTQAKEENKVNTNEATIKNNEKEMLELQEKLNSELQHEEKYKNDLVAAKVHLLEANAKKEAIEKELEAAMKDQKKSSDEIKKL